MKKQNTSLIIGLILIAVVMGYYFSSTTFSTVLPLGEYNQDGTCKVTTNLEPFNSPYSDYENADVWIAADGDGNGIKEKYGYASSTSYGSSRGSGCGATGGAALLLENFNSNLDDMYYKFTGGRNTIFVCSADGTKAKIFLEDCCHTNQLPANNSITVCDVCTPHCTGKTCGSNGCGGVCGVCSASQVCNSNNNCVAANCQESWVYSEWTVCASGVQTRTATDSNNCGTTLLRLPLSQYCAFSCTPNWVCSGWGTCANNVQVQSCTDSNNCNIAKPAGLELRACTSCNPSWSCTAYGTCNNNIQTRSCTDSNSCGVVTGKPVETQACGQCINGATSQCSNIDNCLGTTTCADNVWGACVSSLSKCSDGTCKAICTSGTGTGTGNGTGTGTGTGTATCATGQTKCLDGTCQATCGVNNIPMWMWIAGGIALFILLLVVLKK